MELNAKVLNSSEKVLMHFVALGEGDVSTYKNLMSEKAGLGSTYLYKLNKAYYQKMGNTGSASDWVKIAGAAPTKAGVFSMPADEIVLGRPIYTLQENVVVGTDDVVRGTLKHIDGWEEFSSNSDEQSGYYVSLYVPLPEGTTSAKMQKDSGKEVTIDDGIIVLLIKEETKTLKVTITTDSGSLTRNLDLSKLEKI